jgi:hypothetical protein
VGGPGHARASQCLGVGWTRGGRQANICAVASKYDLFWQQHAATLRDLVGAAARGERAVADFSLIAVLGDRAAWNGSATIRGTSVVKTSMAHMVSLGGFLATSGVCAAWPQRTFVFSMNRVCSLSVTTTAARESSGRAQAAKPAAERRLDPVARPASSVGLELGATVACARVHAALGVLSRYQSPREAPFSDGLYFFFEVGEASRHGATRVVRIGNHPHKQGRLVGRLGEHYRTRPNAKNGSVFRRYLGGALLRRDGIDTCLQPAPGRGHWESGTGIECEHCTGYEDLVTACLCERFSFACVRIEDQALRNRLEQRLIASVAHCQECHPSAQWLGRYAYPANVRASGLWNSHHVNGPLATEADIAAFEQLATVSRRPQGVRAARDLSGTLLLIPCSAGKRGTRALPTPVCCIDQFLGRDAVRVLEEGRVQAFRRAPIDRSDSPLPAVARYSGQPYETEGVVDGLLAAMGRGLHVLIVSGGYGVVHAEEPIHAYEAQMGRTRSIWRERVPIILRDYVSANAITRTFGAFSGEYASVVPDRLSGEDWRAVPRYRELSTTLAPVRAVPRRVAELLLGFLANSDQPGDGWVRT